MSILLHTIILVSLAVASPSTNRQQPLGLQPSQPTRLNLPVSASYEDWRVIRAAHHFVTLHPNPIQRNAGFTVVITGIFRARIPPNAPINMFIAVPAALNPPVPAQNYTYVDEFCAVTGPITQPASANDILNNAKIYDNMIQTCNRDETPVRAVLPREARIEQAEDVFWAYSEGMWFIQLDARMPEGDERRIFCLNIEVEMI